MDCQIPQNRIESAPWTDRVQTEPLEFSSGYLELPMKPGLGVDLDEEVIASRPYDPPEGERYRYRDGAPL